MFKLLWTVVEYSDSTLCQFPGYKYPQLGRFFTPTCCQLASKIIENLITVSSDPV